MYEAFFGLTTKPFSLVPDPRFLFLGKTHKKALHYLRYGLQEGAGFILLTGEVGSGKTTILKDFVRRIEADTVLATIFNTSLTGDQLLAAINEEFGLTTDGQDKRVLQRDLNDFLIQQYSLNIRSILIIDEAQNLTPQSLEEIRLLSNLESGGTKLLQIVLIGQPELKEILDRNELRQLRQRIAVNCHLGPLNLQEVEDYIHYRLEQAGNRNAVRFELGSMEVIYNYSGGIPRLINRICDFLLLAAFGEETTELSLELVLEISRESGEDPGRNTEVRTVPKNPEENADSRMEELGADFYRLLSGVLEKERIYEKLTLYESVLKKMIRKQRREYDALEQAMEKLSYRLDQLEKKDKIRVVK